MQPAVGWLATRVGTTRFGFLAQTTHHAWCSAQPQVLRPGDGTRAKRRGQRMLVLDSLPARHGHTHSTDVRGIRLAGYVQRPATLSGSGGQTAMRFTRCRPVFLSIAWYTRPPQSGVTLICRNRTSFSSDATCRSTVTVSAQHGSQHGRSTGIVLKRCMPPGFLGGCDLPTCRHRGQ